MRIAMFHLGFFYSGGGEKLVLEEIRGLRAAGHEVDCFAPYVDRVRCFPDLREMRQVRSLIPPLPSWVPFRDALSILLVCITVPFMFWRFRRYDVFLGANQPGPWFAYVLSRFLRKPYVIYLAQPLRLLHPRRVDLENGLRIREGDHRFLMALKKTAGFIIDWADRASVRGAEYVLTNGEYVSAWIQQIYGVQTVTCPAGSHLVDSDQLDYPGRFRGTVRVNGSIVRKPYILLTNRHSPMKRFDYAIAAMPAVLREAPNIRLIITGQKTSYSTALQRQIDELRLGDAVQMIGLVTEADLQRLYRHAAAYVYPSPEEDFGMGIVEAMAAGVAVVAWDNGGPTGTVKHGETGYLVPPYDRAGFARSMTTLATNAPVAERMGRAGYTRAKELFSYTRHHRILERALVAAISPSIDIEEVDSAAPRPAQMRRSQPVGLQSALGSTWSDGSVAEAISPARPGAHNAEPENSFRQRKQG